MKRLLSIFLVLGIMLSTFTVTVFAETKDKDYSILKMLNIMVGDEDGNMRLGDNVTRAEFTKVAMTISNFRNSIPLTQKTSPFADVQYSHWASSYIRAGIDNGIVQGYPDSTFRPDNDVKYEEALTILLKVLGYKDSDFGYSYPYGQYSLADSIGLTDGIDASLGEVLNRRQVADLLVNALETEFKDSPNSPYANFDVTKIEDVILMATAKEDESVPHNKILTSAGTYKFDTDLSGDINKKGTIILKDGDTIIYFNPDNGNEITEHAVYSVLSDSILTYKDGEFLQMTFADNTVTYLETKPTTFSAVKPTLKTGDIISVIKNDNGETDYLSISKGKYEGPFVYETYGLLQKNISDINDYLVMKNGNIIPADELYKNDVYYFYKDLKILMAYDTKVTGIYNFATPNQDVPVTIDVSGKTYEIESPDAFKLLSSTGKFKYGDAVTLLLGKDKKIAGVIGTDKTEGNNVGYLIDAGTKLYETSNDKEVTEYYVSVLYPDGNTETHKADKDYSDYKNSVVKVAFENEKSVITRLGNESHKVSGTFNADSRTFGDYSVSKDVEILDVSTIDSDDSPLYVTVKMQRLDGVIIDSNSVLHCEVNEKNEVIELILKDVTGDYYSYGYVTKVEKIFEMMTGTYKYTFDGTLQTHSSQGRIYGVNRGPAKITIGAAGIEGMQNISKIPGDITDINNTYVTAGGIHHMIAEDVKIFYPNSEWDYMRLTMDDILAKDSKYDISGLYYDKPTKKGGRVRIIMVTEKTAK